MILDELNNQSVSKAADARRRWQKLLAAHLPVFETDSIWRYSRLRNENDAEQGWKLHVSATILTAATILETVAPFLKSVAAFYKVPISLDELQKLNAGIFYDYSQIGKFITVYPQNDEQAVFFAERLHRLTAKFAAPLIPFEIRLKPRSCVYYRYGAFKINELQDADGKTVLAVRGANNELIPDRRDCFGNHPAWAVNPFPNESDAGQTGDSRLKKNFRICRVLAQRGKGGVYQAIDLSGLTPRPCLLKEGRGSGEVEWNGRDGFWRINHETQVLEILQSANINVPQVFSSFVEDGNFYLAAEFIEGANLHLFLKKRERRLSVWRAVNFAVQLAEIIARIHAAGWLWRDCKPDNIIVGKKGELRPIDFEGACLIEKPDFTAWNTLGIKSADRAENIFRQTTEAVDLYALGAIIYLLLEGELPAAAEDKIPAFSRRNIPPELRKLILNLLDPRTVKASNAESVRRELMKILNSQNRCRTDSKNCC